MQFCPIRVSAACIGAYLYRYCIPVPVLIYDNVITLGEWQYANPTGTVQVLTRIGLYLGSTSTYR
jgi:hypothetical protein